MLFARYRAFDKALRVFHVADSGLDFFGTNEGLVAGYSSAEGTSGDGDSSEPDGGPGSCGGGGGGGGGGGFAGGGLPQHIRARLESQSKYIAQLEEQNLDLQEVPGAMAPHLSCRRGLAHMQTRMCLDETTSW